MGETLILGIETSCDETAAAVVAGGRVLKSNIIASQVPEHRKFGGVVPEIASRRHLELINSVIDTALLEAGTSLTDLAAIAVTHGPGLVGALLVGVNTAKTLAFACGKPLVAVDHITAHVAANYLVHDVAFPSVCLVASGGHTSLLYLEGRGAYRSLGETRDDAAGEAFDKVARALCLGYPGGPAIDSCALQGDPVAFAFPRALLDRENYEFSFSGLKSAVINTLHNLRQRGEDVNTADIAAGFQAAVVDILVEKTRKAAVQTGALSVLLAGGVAANRLLRKQLAQVLAEENIAFYYPPPELCTDNAAMVAAAGYDLLRQEQFAGFDLNATPAPDILQHKQ